MKIEHPYYSIQYEYLRRCRRRRDKKKIQSSNGFVCPGPGTEESTLRKGCTLAWPPHLALNLPPGQVLGKGQTEVDGTRET